MTKRSAALASTILIGFFAGSGCAGCTKARDPEVVQLDGELLNEFVPAGASSEIVSLVRISTERLQDEHSSPINLALVVDTSGSMAGQPMQDARTASLELLEMLAPGDRLAIVAFGSRPEVVVESTRLADGSRDSIRTQIEGMTARGTTDLAGGLAAGIREVRRHLSSNGVNRIVLLSDGVPNDEAPVGELALAAGNSRISITALGLGLEFDESLLGAIAQTSGGNYHFLESSEMMAQVFRDEVRSIQRVVARNATLALRTGPGVTIDRVIGQEVSRTEGGVQVPLGDLMEGDERELVVRLSAHGRRAGSAVELFDAVLSFDDAVGGAGPLSRTLYLGARSTNDEEELATGRNVDVENSAISLQAAAETIEAIRIARDGHVDQAQEILNRNEIAARRAARARRDSRLEAQAASMEQLRGALPSLGWSSSGSFSRARPNAPRARPELILRQAHEDAMDVVLNQ